MLSTVLGFEPGSVDRQSKDPGSNPGTVESVPFSTERF